MKSMENSVNSNNGERKKRDCSNERNGFFGKRHSQESRNKMSASHKAYQQRIHQMQSNNGQNSNYVIKPMTMQEFLSNNPSLDIKGYIKSLMKNENLIRNIIREEIRKLL